MPVCACTRLCTRLHSFGACMRCMRLCTRLGRRCMCAWEGEMYVPGQRMYTRPRQRRCMRLTAFVARVWCMYTWEIQVLCLKWVASRCLGSCFDTGIDASTCYLN